MEKESHVKILRCGKRGGRRGSVELERHGGGIIRDAHKITIPRQGGQVREAEERQKSLIRAELHIQKVARTARVDGCVQGLDDLTGKSGARNSANRI